MRTLILVVLSVVVFAGCGGSSDTSVRTNDENGNPTGNQQAAAPAATTQVDPEQEAAASRADAELRAGELLDEWSDKLTRALLIGKERRDAVVAGDRDAVARVDRRFRPALTPILAFGRRGRLIMSQYPQDALTKAVRATGDAWAHWALAIRQHSNATFEQAQQIADLALDAMQAQAAAYKEAGKELPVAFQRRPDQR